MLLAQAINISSPALKRLFERVDHPKQVNGKGWNIEQWQKYADENIHFWRQRDPFKKASGPNARDAAYIERQVIEAEKAQFDLDVKRSKYELKAVMSERVLTNWSFFIRELDKLFKHELPPRLEGMSAGAIARLLGDRLDDLRERAAKAMESRNGSEPKLA